jgi:hypothetical protein
MRLEEILIEQQLDERPMGVLGKIGAKAQSFVPGRTGRRAQGKLEVGAMANEISDKFDLFLGKVGGPEGATPELVISFLKKNGYPTKGAEAAMKDPTMAQKAGAAVGAAAKGVKKAASAAAGAATNVAQGAKNAAAKVAAKPAAKTAPIPTQTDQAQAKAGNTNLAASVDRSNMTTIAEGFSGAQLDKIFMAAAKDKIAADEGGIAAPSAGKVDPADAGKPGAGGFASSFKQAYNKAKTGTDGATDANTASTAGDQPAAQATAAPGEIPAEIQKQIDELNPADKKQLAMMI